MPTQSSGQSGGSGNSSGSGGSQSSGASESSGSGFSGSSGSDSGSSGLGSNSSVGSGSSGSGSSDASGSGSSGSASGSSVSGSSESSSNSSGSSSGSGSSEASSLSGSSASGSSGSSSGSGFNSGSSNSSNSPSGSSSGSASSTSGSSQSSNGSSNSSSGSPSASSSQSASSESSYSSYSTISPTTVSFDPNPVITGYSLPITSSTIKRTVNATVTPASDANNITFDVSGVVRVGVKIISADNATGIIILEVKGNGTGPTPVSSPSGDTTINAKYSGNTVGQAQAIVVIPVTQKHKVETSFCINSSEPPSSGKTHLFTEAGATVTITFFDQFGNALNAIYDGTGYVSETWTNQIVKYTNPETDGPIELPTGNLSSGVLLDKTSFTLGYSLAPELTPAERQNWVAFTYIIPGTNANNLFEYFALSKLPYLQATQSLTVHGFSVAPSFVRTMTSLHQNYPPTPYSVTDQ